MKKAGCLLIALLMALTILCGPFVISAARAEEEYTLPREEGMRQLTFYWFRDSGDYDNCDMWIWFPNADGKGYLFHPCEYGAKVVLNVPEEISKVGFIVRTDCSDPGGTSWGSATKDYDKDRYAELDGDTTEIYLKPGDANQYKSDDHGKTLFQEKRMTMAGITDMDKIQYFLTPAVRIESLDAVKVKDRETGRELEVTELSSLNNQVITGTITVGEELDLSRAYTVQIDGYEAATAMPTKVFDSQAFMERYTYDGNDLGAVTGGNGTVFKVWAPTASRVRLNLFEDGDTSEAYDCLEMTRGDRGVWSAEAPCGHGTYWGTQRLQRSGDLGSTRA